MRKSQPERVKQPVVSAPEPEVPVAPTEVKKVITVKKSNPEKTEKPQTKSNKTLENKSIAKEMKNAIEKQTEKAVSKEKSSTKKIEKKAEEVKNTQQEKNNIKYENLLNEK